MRTQAKKKKGIDLKATRDSEEELDDKDMVLLTRKLKRFFCKNLSGSRAEASSQKGIAWSTLNVKNKDTLKPIVPPK